MLAAFRQVILALDDLKDRWRKSSATETIMHHRLTLKKKKNECMFDKFNRYMERPGISRSSPLPLSLSLPQAPPSLT